LAAWHAEGKSLSCAASDATLTVMKRAADLAFPGEVSSVPLQQALRHQHNAFAAFFARGARYPRFRPARPAVREPRPTDVPKARRVLCLPETAGPAAVHMGRRRTWTWPRSVQRW
jgi:hypothetical protein